MHRILTGLMAIAAAFVSAGTAHAADYFSVRNFSLHDFDEAILDATGREGASIAYFRELATINDEEMRERRLHEEINCHPFYVMDGGEIVDTGYNCMSFFCVGYETEPVICKDRYGKARGGVVEISRRVASRPVRQTQTFFDSYPADQRTDAMKATMRLLEEVSCRPFFLMEYDVIAGQGFTCEEVGEYPRWSAANVCGDDWTDKEGLKCDTPLREDEYQQRLRALGKTSSTNATLSNDGAPSSSAPTGSGATQPPAVPLKTFPDVIEGKYGYTAIVSLATLGIINGYPDGTFKPFQTINRAEFARLFMSGLHASELQDETECFLDVHAQWYSPAACAAKRKGWIQGYPDGRFGPARDITKGEGLKIVVASLGGRIASQSPLPQGVNPDAWYAPYVRKAVETGILLEASFDGDAAATRADAAVWMYRAAKYRAQLAASGEVEGE